MTINESKASFSTPGTDDSAAAGTQVTMPDTLDNHNKNKNNQNHTDSEYDDDYEKPPRSLVRDSSYTKEERNAGDDSDQLEYGQNKHKIINKSSEYSEDEDDDEAKAKREGEELARKPTSEMPPPPGQPMIEPINSVGNQSEADLAFPEGGTRAWLCVLGSWSAMFATFGMVNSGGFLQAWITEHQLKEMSESQIAWIFSVYAALFFFGGVQVGPVFDAYGLKFVLIPGCIGSILSVFFLSLSTEYYQFMLGYGVLGGLSASLIFTPAIACVGHFFYRKRGVATGIAATGGAFGGVVYPLAMDKMVDEIGYGWTIRVVGFINVAMLGVVMLTLKSRIPLNKAAGATIDLKAFKDLRFAFATLGCFMVEFGIFIPVNYLSTYSLHKGLDSSLSYKMAVFLSAGSIFGRFLPGWFADLFGRFNVMIITALLSCISCLAVWLPAGDSEAVTIVFAVLFGIFSGSGISLTPVCISQVCRTEDYGKRYGTAYFIASIGVLVGLPIGGAIVERQNGAYEGLIIFAGLCYFVGALFFAAARIVGGGAKLRVIY